MPKLHTDPPYYDWDEVRDKVIENLGKDIRDYAGKWKPDSNGRFDDSKPYLDFWHVLVEFYGGDIHNGSVVLMDFDAIYNSYPKPWVREICDEFKRVLGTPDENGEYRIKCEW